VRVRVRRTGGFAGVPREYCVDTAELPPERAEELSGLLRAARLDAPAPPAVRAPDRFRYELVLEEGDRERRVALAETQLTPEQRRLVQWISQRST
jgi:hypothetical protein